MSNFRPINRDAGFLLLPPVDEWRPQRHLARFVGDPSRSIKPHMNQRSLPIFVRSIENPSPTGC
jgi:hypothetical protein